MRQTVFVERRSLTRFIHRPNGYDVGEAEGSRIGHIRRVLIVHVSACTNEEQPAIGHRLSQGEIIAVGSPTAIKKADSHGLGIFNGTNGIRNIAFRSLEYF